MNLIEEFRKKFCYIADGGFEMIKQNGWEDIEKFIIDKCDEFYQDGYLEGEEDNPS